MRLRLRYAKLGKVRFTGHRDLARMFERAMRTGAVPVATSAGYTPRPRLSFGLALPTGAESVAEYLDVELAEPMAATDVPDVVDRLTGVLPVGVTVLAGRLEEGRSASLQEAVTSVTWELTAPSGVDVAAAATRLTDAPRLPLERTRKGETGVDDVRPQVVALDADEGGVLVAELATTGRGLRPAELAALAFPDAEPLAVRALRTHQWIDRDGRRAEVMALDDDVRLPSAPTAVAVPAGSVGT